MPRQLPAQRAADRHRPEAEQQPGRDPAVRAGQRAAGSSGSSAGWPSLSEAEVDVLLDDVMREFHDRHQKTRQFFLQRFEQIRGHLLTDQPLSENRKMLIGAYFTQEYALESAALFNPSMVWHPDQSGLPEGSRRFILSLRATGEGHISSITFRSGTVDAQNHIRIDEPTRFVTAPELVPNTLYDKNLFSRKLIELGIDGPFADQVLATLGDQFTLDELEAAIHRVLHQSRPRHHELEPVAQGMLTLRQGQLRDLLQPRAERLGADHLPLLAHRDQRHRGRPVRRSSTTTTARSAITPPTPPSTAR